MKYIILFLILLIFTITYEKVTEIELCSKVIYTQILKNKPNINKNKADKLSSIICEISKEYDIESKLLNAIIMQESSYKVDSFNHRTKDYGLTQINIINVKRLKLDKNRLITDMKYSIKSGALILSEINSKYPQEEDYWTRYHSNKKKYRNKYYKLVSRYL